MINFKGVLLLLGMLGNALVPSEGFAGQDALLFVPSHARLQQDKNSVQCWSTRAKGYNEDKPNNPQRRTREKNIKKLTPSNDMMTNHKYRLETAGKIGTQRYADPTKIYVGNMNLTATEEQLKALVEPFVPTPWDIGKIEIVRDWKTGQSKGYGFVQFNEPVYATICLQELENKEFLGRRLRVKPANSNSESPLRKQQREEKMRLKALRRAQNPPPPPPPPKSESAEFLAFLDKDLIVPSIDDGDADDDEYDGDEVPGSPPPKGFG